MAVSTGARQLVYNQAVIEALRQEMRRDPRVVLMGEDVAGGAGRDEQGLGDAWGGPFGTSKGLVKEFGRDRVLDTPISEMGFIGAAVGAVLAAALMIFGRTLYASAVCLLAVFAQVALLFYLMGAPLVAFMLVMIYAGAVMVLVVISIMATPPRLRQIWSSSAMPKALAVLLILLLGVQLLPAFQNPGVSALPEVPWPSLATDVAAVLYGPYALLTETVAVLVFLACLAVREAGRKT